jgi:hypothetical protein
MSIEIYTTGYPRSGSTWINRLLSAALDSPLQTPAGEKPERRFCKTGKGGFVIRKTHFKRPQWKLKKPIVFIQRDPRDIAVSAWHYRRLENEPTGLISVLGGMTGEGTKGWSMDGKHEPGWAVTGEPKQILYLIWVEPWLKDPGVVKTRYEDLHEHPILELTRIVRELTGKTLTIQEAKAAHAHVLFGKWLKHFPHSMRKGVAGDWKNHFKRLHGKYVNDYFGDFMIKQGYIDDKDWWSKLPE